MPPAASPAPLRSSPPAQGLPSERGDPTVGGQPRSAAGSLPAAIIAPPFPINRRGFTWYRRGGFYPSFVQPANFIGHRSFNNPPPSLSNHHRHHHHRHLHHRRHHHHQEPPRLGGGGAVNKKALDPFPPRGQPAARNHSRGRCLRPARVDLGLPSRRQCGFKSATHPPPLFVSSLTVQTARGSKSMPFPEAEVIPVRD